MMDSFKPSWQDQLKEDEEVRHDLFKFFNQRGVNVQVRVVVTQRMGQGQTIKEILFDRIFSSVKTDAADRQTNHKKVIVLQNDFDLHLGWNAAIARWYPVNLSCTNFGPYARNNPINRHWDCPDQDKRIDQVRTKQQLRAFTSGSSPLFPKGDVWQEMGGHRKMTVFTIFSFLFPKMPKSIQVLTSN